MTDNFIEGTVTEDGQAVADAIVAAIRQEDASNLSQSQATTLDAIAKLTDANGEYRFSEEELYNNVNKYHVVAHKNSGTPRRGQENYPFVDATGPAIPDSGKARYEFEQDVTDSWNNNDLTDNTSAGYTSSSEVGSHAIVLDGTDDYLTVPFDFGANDDFSIVGWINVQNIQSNNAFAAQRDSFSSMDWQLYYASSTSVWNLDIGNSRASQHSGNTSISNQTYYHIGLTKGGNDWTLYIDGSSDISVTDSTSWTTNDTLTLGAWQSGSGGPLDGYLDHIDFFTKELTQTEVQNHQNSGSING